MAGTKQKVSDRSLIGPEGVDYDQAEGCKYTLVKATGVDGKGAPVFSDVQSFEYRPSATTPMGRAFELFGFLTKVGNEANSVLNDKDSPGTIDDAAAAISEWLSKGQWASDRVAGPRFDKDKLALAIAQAKGETDPAPYLSKMDTMVTAKGAKKEIPYGQYAYSMPVVREKYDILVGRTKDIAVL